MPPARDNLLFTGHRHREERASSRAGRFLDSRKLPHPGRKHGDGFWTARRMIWSRTSPRAEIAATSQCDLLISAIDCKGGTERRNRAQRGVFSSHGEPLLV